MAECTAWRPIQVCSRGRVPAIMRTVLVADLVSSHAGVDWSCVVNAGALLWVVATEKPVFSSPCSGVSGQGASPAAWCTAHGNSHDFVVIGGHDGCVRRLRAADGAVCWAVQCQAPVFGSPAVGPGTATVAPTSTQKQGVAVWCTTAGRMHAVCLASGEACLGAGVDSVPVGRTQPPAQVFSSPVLAVLPGTLASSTEHPALGAGSSAVGVVTAQRPPAYVCWVGSRDDHVHAMWLA